MHTRTHKGSRNTHACTYFYRKTHRNKLDADDSGYLLEVGVAEGRELQGV